MQRLKVVWICNFSNEEVRSKLDLCSNKFENLLRSILKVQSRHYSDFANWISNGIEEFEKFTDIEMHVISPHYGMKCTIENFIIRDINYCFFKSDDNSLFKRTFNHLTKNAFNSYNGNRKLVRNIISSIEPDIIHMYGAENPYYSITALDINTKLYPFLVSMQTLMNEPEFELKYRTSKSHKYKFRANIERQVLAKTKYIGSSNSKYRVIVWDRINPIGIFTKTFLATVPHIPLIPNSKIYDFVYFSASINKGADFAIEAFSIASRKYPDLTLNIIGNTSEPFTKKLKACIKEHGIEKNVVFSGKLRTHEDVFKQIQLSKFALLPQRISNAPSTIREAMFCGLPVVAKATPGTVILNEDRESVLLSEPDDHQEMANNMIKLIESPDFARKLAKNGLKTARERWNNKEIMLELVVAYRAIIDHHRYGTPIPDKIGVVNPNLL